MKRDVFLVTRAGEPANFFPAPAPRVFFQAAPAPNFFFKRLQLQEVKTKRLLEAPAINYLLSLVKYFFFPQTDNVKLQEI